MDIRIQKKENMMNKKRQTIQRALDIAIRFGGIDGDHHKAWVIDQMVRALTGCPEHEQHLTDVNGKQYVAHTLGESEEYKKLVREACNGEYGPDSYDWDIGVPP